MFSAFFFKFFLPYNRKGGKIYDHIMCVGLAGINTICRPVIINRSCGIMASNFGLSTDDYR